MTTAKPPEQKEHLSTDHPPMHERKRKRLEQQLDNALEDSFPASDPPSQTAPTKVQPAGDPKTKP